MNKQKIPCPCSPKQDYSLCCQPLHNGSPAKTAEELMRSRYSAYVMELDNYLMASWHHSTRPESLNLEKTQWIGLKILATELGKEADKTGIVEFVARYKVNGKAHRLQEKSRFVYEGGNWFYIDGQHD